MSWKSSSITRTSETTLTPMRRRHLAARERGRARIRVGVDVDVHHVEPVAAQERVVGLRRRPCCRRRRSRRGARRGRCRADRRPGPARRQVVAVGREHAAAGQRRVRVRLRAREELVAQADVQLERDRQAEVVLDEVALVERRGLEVLGADRLGEPRIGVRPAGRRIDRALLGQTGTGRVGVTAAAHARHRRQPAEHERAVDVGRPLLERHRQQVEARPSRCARPSSSVRLSTKWKPRSRVRRCPLALPLKLPMPLMSMFGRIGIGRRRRSRCRASRRGTAPR